MHITEVNQMALMLARSQGMTPADCRRTARYLARHQDAAPLALARDMAREWEAVAEYLEQERGGK